MNQAQTQPSASHEKHGGHKIAGFSDRTHVLIWLALVVLTGVTVTATTLRLGHLSILAAILVALIKASLVILFFMNIAKEPPIFRIMLAVAVATLGVIMALTFFDVLFR